MGSAGRGDQVRGRQRSHRRFYSCCPPPHHEKNVSGRGVRGRAGLQAAGQRAEESRSPVPKYVYSKCCNDVGHIENFSDPEIDEEIVGES